MEITHLKIKFDKKIICLTCELIDKTEGDNDHEFHYLLNDFLSIFNKKKNRLDEENFNKISELANKAFGNKNPLGLNLPEIIERQKLNPLK